MFDKYLALPGYPIAKSGGLEENENWDLTPVFICRGYRP